MNNVNPSENVTLLREDSCPQTVLIFDPRDDANYTTLNNTSRMNADAQFLGIEIRGDAAAMTLVVPSGRRLTARNGIRLSAGGRLTVSGGELNTVRDLDIRAGGVLSGSGLINGQQQVIAGIPEFANQGLFEPNVINGGQLQVGGALAGVLTIKGDYEQHDRGGRDAVVVRGPAGNHALGAH